MSIEDQISELIDKYEGFIQRVIVEHYSTVDIDLVEKIYQ